MRIFTSGLIETLKSGFIPFSVMAETSTGIWPKKVTFDFAATANRSNLKSDVASILSNVIGRNPSGSTHCWPGASPIATVCLIGSIFAIMLKAGLVGSTFRVNGRLISTVYAPDFNGVLSGVALFRRSIHS